MKLLIKSLERVISSKLHLFYLQLFQFQSLEPFQRQLEPGELESDKQQPDGLTISELEQSAEFQQAAVPSMNQIPLIDPAQQLTKPDSSEPELLAAEAQLQDQTTPDQVKDQAKNEFLANLSHELRTPLSVILGLTQLLQSNRNLPAECQRDLEAINTSSEHLLTLVNDSLNLLKAEAGQLSLQKNAFNLHLLLSDLKSILGSKAAAKNLQLIVRYSPDLPQIIQADEVKLRQVLINLLGNAIKFTQQGSVLLKVKRHRDQDNSLQIQFEVEDTGVGIAPTDFDQLFQPFQQTQSGLALGEGTGLGLAISQTYVQMMGGKITVQSHLNEGSVFSFRLPVEPIDLPRPQPPEPSLQVIGLAPGQPTYRILIADDHPASRLLLTKLLTIPGLELRQATNGEEALLLWQTWRPQLIFMDLKMPIMDGWTATKQIRQQEQLQRLSSVVIIALSAGMFEGQLQQIQLIGCNDFIAKPYKTAEIFDKMAQHMEIKYLFEKTANCTLL
jgi:signal transduction histidine kinase/ActR/RegA family two-component response regulator